MDRPKVLKRNITPEIQASRQRDMETILDNYRENLRDHGITNEKAIDHFVSEEREKMEKEYESLDRGDTSSNIYHTPNNWKEIADGLRGESNEESNEDEEEMSM